MKSTRRGILATFQNKGRRSPSPSCSPLGAASLAGASHDCQDVEENVDDVSVEVKCSKNVFLWTQGQLLVSQEKLSINSQKLHRQKMELVHFVYNLFGRQLLLHILWPYTNKALHCDHLPNIILNPFVWRYLAPRC